VRLPNFLLAGAAKSGTTTLWSHLKKHPDIFMSPKKEIKFFDRRYAAGIDSYKSYFDGWTGQTAIGEATQTYLYLPQSAERIARHLPNVKLVFSLRNPVDRAYSHYWHAVTRGDEYLSFEKALDREPQRLAKNFYCRRIFSYQDRGRYLQQIKRYTDIFDRSQLLFLLFEDLVDSTDQVLAELYRFLGVDDQFRSQQHHRKENVGKYPRSLLLQKTANYLFFSLRMLCYDHLEPNRAQAMRHVIKRFGAVPMRRLNLRERRYPKMRVETRQRLLHEFEEGNRELSRLINKDLSRWNK
jgi:hypothetical protein